jgi:protein-S-isoprenylcysteine O-methyltransferase Ste14
MRENTTGPGLHPLDALRILTVVSVAIYFIPEGAHFFEMFNKLKLTPSDYLIVQRIYDDWAFFGVAIVVALGCTLLHAIAMRSNPRSRRLSLASFASLIVTQAIFWSFIYPMNSLTQNWTAMPANFEAVRRQWEYAHAASAGVTLLALVLVLCAVIPGARADRSVADGSSMDAAGRTGNVPPLTLAITAVLAASGFLGLAILGWGGLQPFFSHAPLTALTVATALLTVASMFTAGNLSSGVREDRSNGWVLAAFAILGLLIGWVPALTDRMDWGTIDGDTTRWLGVAIYMIGGVVRLWPVFVLGNRFSGLVAIQPGHRLVTTGPYRRIRHPSYLGMLISVLGWALSSGRSRA